ncbi:hypothetical protein RCL1_006282 [Eukaryota sp. TZLM3-RCL]
MHGLLILSSRGGNILYHRQFTPNFGFSSENDVAKTPESLAAVLYILYSKSNDVFPSSSSNLCQIDSSVSIYFHCSKEDALLCVVLADRSLSSAHLSDTPGSTPLQWLCKRLLSSFCSTFAASLVSRTSSTPGATPRITAQGRTFSNFTSSIANVAVELFIEISKSCCSLFSISPWLFIASLSQLDKTDAGSICVFLDSEGPVLPAGAMNICGSLINMCLLVFETMSGTKESWFYNEVLLPETGHSISIIMTNKLLFACPLSLNDFKEAFKGNLVLSLINWANFCVANGVDVLCEFT